MKVISILFVAGCLFFASCSADYDSDSGWLPYYKGKDYSFVILNKNGETRPIRQQSAWIEKFLCLSFDRKTFWTLGKPEQNSAPVKNTDVKTYRILSSGEREPVLPPKKHELFAAWDPERKSSADSPIGMSLYQYDFKGNFCKKIDLPFFGITHRTEIFFDEKHGKIAFRVMELNFDRMLSVLNKQKIVYPYWDSVLYVYDINKKEKVEYLRTPLDQKDSEENLPWMLAFDYPYFLLKKADESGLVLFDLSKNKIGAEKKIAGGDSMRFVANVPNEGFVFMECNGQTGLQEFKLYSFDSLVELSSSKIVEAQKERRFNVFGEYIVYLPWTKTISCQYKGFFENRRIENKQIKGVEKVLRENDFYKYKKKSWTFYWDIADGATLISVSPE